jgi:RHS repeat-associated protein
MRSATLTIDLYYYRARYYSPRLGRFLQIDPVGDDDDINLYLYSGNEPSNFVDQTGASKKWVATLVKVSGKGMKELGRLSKAGAVRLRRQGESVLAQSRQKAREIEVAAHGEAKLVRHKAHQADFRPHYQTEDKPGHSFWTAVLGSALLAAADVGDSVAEASEAAGAALEQNASLIGDIAALADPISLMKSGDMPPPPGFVEGPFGTWTKVSSQNTDEDSEEDKKNCTGTRTTRDESDPCPW